MDDGEDAVEKQKNGVLDRCRGEPPDEFKTVDGYEPVDHSVSVTVTEIICKGLIMSPGTITQRNEVDDIGAPAQKAGKNNGVIVPPEAGS